jgi:hypothetical protein
MSHTRTHTKVSYFPSDLTNHHSNHNLVFDMINVARIHNSSIPSGDVLDSSTVQSLQLYANQHEWGLAYNASDNARAVPGMQLAGEILSFLNSSVTKKTAPKLGIQFGAYASFLSFFGLADLPAANGNFMGIPDYASSMVFEVFGNTTNSTVLPALSELSVRFLFVNGTASVSGEPQPYPLFGGASSVMSWTDFSSKMANISIDTTEQWCTVCGNSTGVCAGSGNSSASSSGSGSSGHKGMSAAVGGVIGAMVTLAVILGAGLLLAVSGMRLVKKSKAVPAAKTG